MTVSAPQISASRGIIPARAAAGPGSWPLPAAARSSSRLPPGRCHPMVPILPPFGNRDHAAASAASVGLGTGRLVLLPGGGQDDDRSGQRGGALGREPGTAGFLPDDLGVGRG